MQRLAIIVSVLVASAGLAQEPWEQLGPRGLTVAAMASVPGNPDDVYFVTQGYPARIFYTSNAGRTWTLRDTIHDRVNALVTHPTSVQTLYAGSEQGRVYRSTDGGQSWTVRGSLSGGPVLRQLAFEPDEPLVMWASADVPISPAYSGLGVFHSTDGGADWNGTWVDSGHTVRSLLLGPDPSRGHRLFLGGTVNNRARLLRSDDGGENWQDISDGLEGDCAYSVAVSPTDSAVLVCATDFGIFRSTNLGTSWGVCTPPTPAYSVGFTSRSPHYGYAGGDNLVFRSNDNGRSWSAETTDFFGTTTRWLGLNPDQPLELYAGNGAGIFYSSDGGFAWEEATGELHCLTVPFLRPLGMGSDNLYTCPPGYGVLATWDRGRTWSRQFVKLPNSGHTTGFDPKPRNPDTIALVTSFDNDLHLTIDRGDSWVAFPIAFHYSGKGVKYHPVGPDTLYTWGGRADSVTGPREFAIYKSTSGGRTWSAMTTQDGRGDCQGFDFIGSGETLYAWGQADDNAAIFRSTNRGGTWARINTGVTGSHVSDFCRSRANPDVYFCATPTGVFRTLNRGQNWTNLGLGAVTSVLPDTASEDCVFAGTDTQGIFFTTNAGSLWERDTIGLNSRTVTFLSRHPDVPSATYCGTSGAGLYGRGIIGILEPRSSFIVHRSSHQSISPSVIRSSAEIRLTGLTGSRTTIDLFSEDGSLVQRVAALSAAPATYSWNRPRAIGAGVYFLVVRSGGTETAAKVILAPAE